MLRVISFDFCWPFQQLSIVDIHHYNIAQDQTHFQNSQAPIPLSSLLYSCYSSFQHQAKGGEGRYMHTWEETQVFENMLAATKKPLPGGKV